MEIKTILINIAKTLNCDKNKLIEEIQIMLQYTTHEDIIDFIHN